MQSLPRFHRTLMTAIDRKRLIACLVDGKRRVAEPHDYGVHKGKVRLFAYQIEGESSAPLPGWRWFDIPKISKLALLRRSFPGNRPAPSGKHHRWDQIFARVRPPEPGERAESTPELGPGKRRVWPRCRKQRPKPRGR
jgi:hypothetical protein